jgi:pimeloyl-ACP methyl ester carboxylesterase
LKQQEKNSQLYVLIHSPLIGPLTWRLVAQEMQQRAIDVLVPRLRDSPASKEPYWQQHARAVSEDLAQTLKDIPVTLVAHSGSGPLLPAIRQAVPNPVHACVFVDAGIPRPGASRLDLMKSEDPEWAAQFQEELERGRRFPTWSMEELKDVIPDQSLRRQMVAELRPRGLDFFTEPIPVFEGWPDAPCVYIQFSAPYRRPAAHARQTGWPTYEMEAGHFNMLVDPRAVTDLILQAVAKQS